MLATITDIEKFHFLLDVILVNLLKSKKFNEYYKQPNISYFFKSCKNEI